MPAGDGFLLVLLMTGSVFPRALPARRPFQGILMSSVVPFPDSSLLFRSFECHPCHLDKALWHLDKLPEATCPLSEALG